MTIRDDFLKIGNLRDRRVVAVCCAFNPPEHEERLAYEVGAEIARRNAILVCGGLAGSMEASCKGAKDHGGLTIGITPYYEKEKANPWVDIVIPTGLGHARNMLVVSTADGVIGVGGSWGTLSELAIAVKMRKSVAVLNGWSAAAGSKNGLDLIQTRTPEEAVTVALGDLHGQLRMKGF